MLIELRQNWNYTGTDINIYDFFNYGLTYIDTDTLIEFRTNWNFTEAINIIFDIVIPLNKALLPKNECVDVINSMITDDLSESKQKFLKCIIKLFK
jgi:hypothetical protein